MEFDEFLKNEEPLPDEGFTRAVMARVERQRRSRRIAIGIAIGVAAVAALFARPSFIVPSTEVIVGALILMSVCGLAWIESERTA